MKRTGMVATIFFLLMLMLPLSGAHAATDGIYLMSAPTTILSWDGTDANRLKPAVQQEYDYTYGDETNIAFDFPASFGTFSFYGTAYHSITADTNGIIWFGTPGVGPAIRAWNTDLSSIYYGGVFVQHFTSPERIVIEWQTETYTEEGLYLPNNFEVVLFKDGTIRLDYKSFTTPNGTDNGSGIADGGSHSIILPTVYTQAEHSYYVADAVPVLTVEQTTPTKQSSYILTGTVAENATVTVAASSPATAGAVTRPTSTTWSCPVTGLVEGYNSFTVTATNQAGGSNSVNGTVTLDTVPPAVFVLNPVTTPTIATSQTLTGTVDAGASVSAAVGTGAATECTITGTTWNCLVNLALGNNTITLTASDAAGNKATLTSAIYSNPGLAAALTPATINADYQGQVGLTISNILPAGAELRVEQFVDANRNGVIDAGDYVVRSFTVTDGLTSANPNIQADSDGLVNNTITTGMNYFLTNDLYHAPGSYLFRVTNGTESAIAPFLIATVAQPQAISGTVTNGTSPVPGAIVRLTDKWQRPVAWSIANGSGAFTLNVKTPGDYIITPLAYGYSTSTTTQLTTISSGQYLAGHDLNLTAGTFHLTGMVKKEQASDPVGGVWVQAKSTTFTGVAMTAIDGTYDLALPSGLYEVAVAADPTVPKPAAKGYLAFTVQPLTVNLTANTAGVDLALPSAAVLVSGRVTDTLGRAVAGLPVRGKLPLTANSREPVAYGVTDANGDYTLAVVAGTAWSIRLDDPAAQILGYIGTGIDNFATTSPLTGNNLSVHPITAWVQGTVKDINNNVVAGNNVRLRTVDSTIVATIKTAADGTYRIGAFAGNWLVSALTGNTDRSPVAEQNVTLSDTQTAAADFTLQYPKSFIGYYQGNGQWFLDANGNAAWDQGIDKNYTYGGAGDIPVYGDWNGSGTTKIGVFNNGTWTLNVSGSGVAGGAGNTTHSFGVGLTGALPVTGDWTGNGTTKIGVYHNGVWYLDLNGNGVWDGTPTDRQYYFGTGLTGAVPVTGDWTGTGITKIGVYVDGTWYLDTNGNGAWDDILIDSLLHFGVGVTGAIPVTGDWNGFGTSKIGIFEPSNSQWYLDTNGSGAWDGTLTDSLYTFGSGFVGAVPIAGAW